MKIESSAREFEFACFLPKNETIWESIRSVVEKKVSEWVP